MKITKLLLSVIAIIIFVFVIMFISINVLNADLYGRLIETSSFNDNKLQDSLSDITVTLVLHKHLVEENAVEASFIVSYERQSLFKKYNTNNLEIVTFFNDAGLYSPSGVKKTLIINDSIKRKTYGNLYNAYESDRFQIPVSPSLNGYPFDNIIFKPFFYIYIDGTQQKFNLAIQKRISGRILSKWEKDVEAIELKRTSTEIYLVTIISTIFLLLIIILTYGLVNKENKLNNVEELITISSFLIAIVGMRELLGITRVNGTSTLEILVILIPIICIFFGIIFSIIKQQKKKKNYR